MEKLASLLATLRRAGRNGMTAGEIVHIREVENRATDGAAGPASGGPCLAKASLPVGSV